MRSEDYLISKGIKFNLIKLSEIPKTAEDVRRIFGCELKEVLKSLVFVGDAQPLLIVLSGDKRVDLEKVKSILNLKSIRKASPEEVFEFTGYVVGSVSPFGIEKPIAIIIDEEVFKLKKVNLGSGEHGFGIEIEADELRKVWGGRVSDVSM